VTRPGFTAFTPAHRGGEGPPLVCLHGFLDTWRTWELVLPALERRHDVLAPTLPGHAGGPALPATITDRAVADGVERLMDAAGIGSAHLAGNSLGGFVALQLASRGRARSVVALAPAGGWARGDRAREDVFAFQAGLLDVLRGAAPHADAVVASPAGRRRATEYLTVRHDHIPPELLAHLTLAGASAPRARDMLEHATQSAWELDAARIDCPVRIVWGTEDRLLPWPSAAARFRREWLPHADWVELDDVGHCPQLDVPLETAQLILGVSAA
jgi:pimeloyl-ACP methyl ester carboxylesterase